jgi:KDO2-lipid IV(A) lauroyltransferase
MQSVVERLPRSWAYALAVLAARFAWMFSPLARPRLDYNLAIVCPELAPVELRKLSWVNFRNHAKAYADLMMLPRMNVEAMRPLMHVDGLENLAQARAMGKGVLVVSCHMGSYEVAAAIWSATVSPVSLFAEELEPRALFEWYRDTRARLGISVLPLHLGGLRKVTQALQEQEIVITAIDRDITGTGQGDAVLRAAGADSDGSRGDRAAHGNATFAGMRLPAARRHLQSGDGASGDSSAHRRPEGG